MGKLFRTAIFVLPVLIAGPVFAQSEVGTVTEVKNNVTGTLASRTRSLAQGLDVFRNERLRARSNSQGTIRLIDKTQLVVGPNSALTLDRFVLGGGNTTRSAVVRMARGVFRFVSGGLSRSSAYKIQTPTATLGIRGTIVDLHVRRKGTSVLVVSGRVEVCGRRSRQCRILSPCEHIYVPRNGSLTRQLDRQKNRAFPFATGTYRAPEGQACNQSQGDVVKALLESDSEGNEPDPTPSDPGPDDDYGHGEGGYGEGGYGEGSHGEGGHGEGGGDNNEG
ncbi:MAG: FecR family protein [Methyloligellaceae bacterium]